MSDNKKRKIQGLVSELSQQRQEKILLDQKLNEQIMQGTQLTQQLMNSRKLIDEFKIKIAKLEKENIDLSSRVFGKNGTKIENIEDVQLQKIVVTSQTQNREFLEGRVLVVNKDYNFVVVDLGKSDGINTDDNFIVYQDDSPVGNIIIEEVRPNMSVAAFISSELKDRVKEGDRVVRQ